MDEKDQLTKRLLHILGQQFVTDNRDAADATIIKQLTQLGILTLQDNHQIMAFLKQLTTLNPYIACVLAIHFSTRQTNLATWAPLSADVKVNQNKLTGQQSLLPGAHFAQQLFLIADDHVYQYELHLDQATTTITFANTPVKVVTSDYHDWHLNLVKFLTAVLAQWQHDMVGYLVEYGKNTLVDGHGLAMLAPTQAQIAHLVTLASDTNLQAQAIANLQPTTEPEHEQVTVAMLASWQALQAIWQTLQQIFNQHGYDDPILWQKWQQAYQAFQAVQAIDANRNATITYAEMHQQR